MQRTAPIFNEGIQASKEILTEPKEMQNAIESVQFPGILNSVNPLPVASLLRIISLLFLTMVAEREVLELEWFPVVNIFISLSYFNIHGVHCQSVTDFWCYIIRFVINY